MNEKIVVYTAIFGSYSGLIEQPRLKNVDYICYTDQDLKSKTWKVIKVNPPVKDDNTRSNRYYKLLPHKHLKNYKTSVYIDSNFLILKDFTQFIQQNLKTHSLLCFDHNQTKSDKRDCIYKEHKGILDFAKSNGLLKDNKEVMQKQMNRFISEGYPSNNGLITAGVLIRNHFDNKVIELMDYWWGIVKNGSKRDQLSFNYAVWKLNFNNFSYLEGDIRTGNQWFRHMSHRKNYTFKIFKIKVQNKIKSIKLFFIGNQK